MKGEYIATYATTGDAALAIGKERSANSSIRNACIGNMNSAYGFQWRFEGDNPPGIYVNRGKMPIRKTTLVDKVCVRCGKPYRGVARSLYCSGDCANAAKLESNQKYKEKIKQQTKEQNTRQAVCKFCGKRFTTTRSNVAYCSSICQHRYNSRLQHERKMAQNRKAGA